MIELQEFLDTIFEYRDDDEHVLVSRKGEEAWWSSPHNGKAVQSWLTRLEDPALYYCVSTVRAPEDGEAWRRQKSDCLMSYVLVLDDVGTKAIAPPVEPSYKLESSAGNFQWGYLLDPTDDLDRFAAIVDAVAELGFADAGAGGYNRLMRVPGSVNTKEGRNKFVSRVTEWHPERSWNLDVLATELGVNLETLRVQRSTTEPSSIGSRLTTEVEDELLTWLAENGHVRNDNASQWVDVCCPWHEGHTTGDDIAGYSPLGRGGEGWEERRGFKCMHEHCRNRTFSDLRDWAIEQGGPRVSGYDPLPWLQARYTYIGDEKKVADMVQRPLGGVWMFDLEAWSNMHLQRIPMPGRERPVLIKNAFLESRDTEIATTSLYLPGHPAVCEMHRQTVVNTYVEPRHLETEELPTVFTRHMEYLLPDIEERECFLDWLAYKVQNPAERSYSVVMVAEDAFGIGRSWVGNILSQMLDGQVSKASLAQLIGRGTSAERTYNDWASGCQFLIVDEAKDVSREDFFNAYETFKQRIDTSPVKFRSNAKYGRTKDETMFFNALIFTNHADAMIIPEDDRRIAVLTNPTTKQDDTYYQDLHRVLRTTEEARRLYWYLKRRDIAAYNPAVPPMTPGKMQMIAASQSPTDEIFDTISEEMGATLITRNQLDERVKRTARAIGYSNMNLDLVVRRIWRQIGSLKPSSKHGLRVTIDTHQQEIRALLGKREWISKLSKLAGEDLREVVLHEIKQHTPETVSFGSFK